MFTDHGTSFVQFVQLHQISRSRCRKAQVALVTFARLTFACAEMVGLRLADGNSRRRHVFIVGPCIARVHNRVQVSKCSWNIDTKQLFGGGKMANDILGDGYWSMGICGIERRFLDSMSRTTDACAYIFQAGDPRRTSERPMPSCSYRRNTSFVLAPYSTCLSKRRRNAMISDK
jgi:hypothetical protein